MYISVKTVACSRGWNKEKKKKIIYVPEYMYIVCVKKKKSWRIKKIK